MSSMMPQCLWCVKKIVLSLHEQVYMSSKQLSLAGWQDRLVSCVWVWSVWNRQTSCGGWWHWAFTKDCTRRSEFNWWCITKSSEMAHIACMYVCMYVCCGRENDLCYVAPYHGAGSIVTYGAHSLAQNVLQHCFQLFLVLKNRWTTTIICMLPLTYPLWHVAIDLPALLQGGQTVSCLSVATSRNHFALMKYLVGAGGKQLLEISEGVCVSAACGWLLHSKQTWLSLSYSGMCHACTMHQDISHI